MSHEYQAQLIVAGNSHWFGDSRLGTFTVYVDGLKVGSVAPGDFLLIPCQPGHHVVRVRQWWFMSPPIDVEIRPEQQTALEGRFNQNGNLVSRMLTGLFLPWRTMTLMPSSSRPVTGNYNGQPRTAGIWYWLGMIAALALLLVGIKSSNVALMSIGGAGFLLSQGLAFRQLREFRRSRRDRQ